MKEFTVLMSVYEKEDPQKLKQSMNSVLNQSMKPKEFLIIKDGKLTAKLDEVLDEYTLNYSNIRIITLKENVGLGVALNIGVSECRTDLIARMDSDDVSVYDRFKKQMLVFEHYPNLDIVGSNIAEFSGDINNIVGRRLVPRTQKEIIKKSPTRNPMNHMTVMFKKKSVEEVGSYIPKKGFEDYYLWLRMLNKNKKFYNLNENLVYARVEENFFNRRTGINYFKQEINFQKDIRKEGLISKEIFIRNIFTRGAVRLLPANIMQLVYQKYIHNNKRNK
ncbi:hypothetical protein LCW_02410 [Latilactobacillus curvatus]|uniref:glycosyltransferase n=1 Tax=Latilactobacillus curvatus TaxID=28038 RepID=UPI00084A240D|nr:glycosyltransferase [Latilactobacillus curvatus]AOO74996.1 hypothetical protein LCW_02410 [Latilactobacillus curvatus]